MNIDYESKAYRTGYQHGDKFYHRGKGSITEAADAGMEKGKRLRNLKTGKDCRNYRQGYIDGATAKAMGF